MTQPKQAQRTCDQCREREPMHWTRFCRECIEQLLPESKRFTNYLTPKPRKSYYET